MRHNALRWGTGLAVLLLVLTACTSGNEPQQGATAPVTTTQAVLTNPFTETGEISPEVTILEDVEAICSPSVVVVANPVARRCTSELQVLHDPCFLGPPRVPQVAVCLQNPARKEAVRLTLIEDRTPVAPGAPPAAAPVAPAPEATPWYIELADGRECARVIGLKGDPPSLEGDPPTYGCGHADFLYGLPDVSEPVWTMPNRKGATAKVRTVDVRTAWY
ncbi:hypothetical protein DI005_27360 [Prauserella sp. PE36]|uniref:Secreted protein n=1 Tax=Prauserella endophytica TaxID=1592324 RepID=A0ABY2RWJ5_9PSEU|nr:MULTISPECIES: hypothetical protein [Prauserella]RBM16000.1 hypothetical protein DI005_27360 [Prauserella sp. PE36]TKG63181.1 hypothetical protein FCN18_30935 [Prauserella endophytica]